jgi:hypothetical protein
VWLDRHVLLTIIYCLGSAARYLEAIMSDRMFANSDFARLGVKKLVGVALFRDNLSTSWVILKGGGWRRYEMCVAKLILHQSLLVKKFLNSPFCSSTTCLTL